MGSKTGGGSDMNSDSVCCATSGSVGFKINPHHDEKMWEESRTSSGISKCHSRCWIFSFVFFNPTRVLEVSEHNPTLHYLCTF